MHSPSTAAIQADRDRIGSSPADPRHTGGSAYRCFLPDLAGFADVRCVGPDLLHRLTAPALNRAASGEHRPRYSGLRVQGTATSPSSTVNLTTNAPPTEHPSAMWMVAEGEGFEPSVPCGTHALQACQINRSCTLPSSRTATQARYPAEMWRRGWDSNPRCLVGTQHFECCTFNRSDTPPRWHHRREAPRDRGPDPHESAAP